MRGFPATVTDSPAIARNSRLAVLPVAFTALYLSGNL